VPARPSGKDGEQFPDINKMYKVTFYWIYIGIPVVCIAAVVFYKVRRAWMISLEYWRK